MLLAAALLTPAGCSADQEPGTTPSASVTSPSAPASTPGQEGGPASVDEGAQGQAEAPTEVPLEWTTTTTRPASDVVNVGGHAMLVASVDKHLELQELSLADGHVEWAHRVSSSMVAPEVAMPVTAVLDRYVAVLEPLTGPGQRARMRLLDTTSRGEAVADTGIHVFTSFPEICSDDASSVCANAISGVKSHEVRLRVDGRQSSRALPDSGDSYEDLGVNGLVRFLEPKTRKATIGVEHGGKLLWHRLEVDVFGKLSSRAGRGFDISDGVVYGTVGMSRPTRANPMPSRRLTVGLDADTGKTLWRMPAADLGCSSRRDVVLVCEWQAGTVRNDGSVEGGRVVVSRIDPNTGKRIWRTRPFFVVGRDAGALGNTGNDVVITETTGRSVIETTTGAVRMALPRDVAWRRVGIQVASNDPHYKGSSPVTTRRGVVNRNEPETEPERFYQPLPDQTGDTFGDLRLLSLAGRVIALKVS